MPKKIAQLGAEIMKTYRKGGANDISINFQKTISDWYGAFITTYTAILHIIVLY
jgi:hypothetical protein